MPDIAICLLSGEETGYRASLSKIDDDCLEWRMPEDFVGREVVEQIEISELRNMADESQDRLDHVLGLLFEASERGVLVTVAVGSGNVRCIVNRLDLLDALDQL